MNEEITLSKFVNKYILILFATSEWLRDTQLSHHISISIISISVSASSGDGSVHPQDRYKDKYMYRRETYTVKTLIYLHFSP